MLFNPESESEPTYVFGVTSDNKTFKFAYAIDEGIRSFNKKLLEFNEPEFKESEFFFHKEISPIDLSLYYSESEVKGWKSIFYISNLLKLLDYFPVLMLFIFGLYVFFLGIYKSFFNNTKNYTDFNILFLCTFSSVMLFVIGYLIYKKIKRDLELFES